MSADHGGRKTRQQAKSCGRKKDGRSNCSERHEEPCLQVYSGIGADASRRDLCPLALSPRKKPPGKAIRKGAFAPVPLSLDAAAGSNGRVARANPRPPPANRLRRQIRTDCAHGSLPGIGRPAGTPNSDVSVQAAGKLRMNSEGPEEETQGLKATFLPRHLRHDRSRAPTLSAAPIEFSRRPFRRALTRSLIGRALILQGATNELFSRLFSGPRS